MEFKNQGKLRFFKNYQQKNLQAKFCELLKF